MRQEKPEIRRAGTLISLKLKKELIRLCKCVLSARGVASVCSLKNKGILVKTSCSKSSSRTVSLFRRTPGSSQIPAAYAREFFIHEIEAGFLKAGLKFICRLVKDAASGVHPEKAYAFLKTGFDAPRADFSLARDDLEETQAVFAPLLLMTGDQLRRESG